MDLVYDQDEIWLPKIEEALYYCDIFIPSDYEVECVCGLKDSMEIKEFFRPYGISVFGIKLGAKGVFLTDYNKDIFVPSAYHGVPVETLGAGDAFFAAFNISYHRGYELEHCAVIASCASACILGHYGASTGMVRFEELLKMAEALEEKGVK
jgi:fructokinase